MKYSQQFRSEEIPHRIFSSKRNKHMQLHSLWQLIMPEQWVSEFLHLEIALLSTRGTYANYSHHTVNQPTLPHLLPHSAYTAELANL
ncbi:hypothetical protein M514_22677 [Trichuris suis]|uniref:Uncharacterized protein n=1 Tax=Trichuris suis TaxID=68888 RepID=A0A085N6K1_9BILA|nr:hypothetical protein M514_22677 [Trichuris suis]